MAQNAGAASSHGRIVIAEDDDATRMLLCAVLDRAGFTVRAFENGQLAFDAVRAEKPDVILLDWMMPVLDGCAAASLFKANLDTRGIPIVMLTTQSEIEERVIALEAGVQDFITKPFDPRELVARIDQQMRWRKLLAVDANEAFAAQRLQLYRTWETRPESSPEKSDLVERIWSGDSKKKSKNRGWR